MRNVSARFQKSGSGMGSQAKRCLATISKAACNISKENILKFVYVIFFCESYFVVTSQSPILIREPSCNCIAFRAAAVPMQSTNPEKILLIFTGLLIFTADRHPYFRAGIAHRGHFPYLSVSTCAKSHYSSLLNLKSFFEVSKKFRGKN